MKVRPVHFVADVDEAARFYEALGLQVRERARTGGWIELRASGGELALHDAASAGDGEGRTGLLFSFVAEEPLETVARRCARRGSHRRATQSTRSGAARCSCARPTGRWCRSTNRNRSSTREGGPRGPDQTRRRS